MKKLLIILFTFVIIQSSLITIAFATTTVSPMKSTKEILGDSPQNIKPKDINIENKTVNNHGGLDSGKTGEILGLIVMLVGFIIWLAAT